MSASAQRDSQHQVCLTGIQATGDPHLGNLVGAIRPALRLAERFDSLYFIADYHALTTVRDPAEIAHSTRSVAATWLAAGLDPDRTVLYRQSDVPEIFELTWALSCLTPKGLMNRAHAYKAARDRNREQGVEDLDAGINMGTYNYPVLMAADIIIMDTDFVPVGRDQAQHVEYAADIAGAFNAVFGGHVLKVPKPLVPTEETAQSLPGTDGRKMSKSYGNTIPVGLPENELRKVIRRIPTDSTPVAEPKDPDSSVVFQILAHFAPPEVTARTREELKAGGLGWGELKDRLFTVLNSELTPMRECYDAMMAPDSPLDGLLAEGAEKAREHARPVLARVRRAVGISGWPC
ncbi:MAG TPA: tryptophan--tRNA ligase [Streptosporangiaceae bacterium]|nr:tryptophan--tRNA ligase [Streptosporangiaceae bacterium]